MSQTTIGAWERGENSPTPENLVALASALGVEPSVFTVQLRQQEPEPQEFVEGRPVRLQTAREWVPSPLRKAIAEKFEKEVWNLLHDAKITGEWHKTERAPNGIQWTPDFQSDKVVVEFKLVESRMQMGLQTTLAASLWRLVTMRAHLKDSRSYAVIIHSLPDEDGQPQFENDLLGEHRLKRPSTAARLHRLQAEAALVGISLYAVASPLEAAETIMALEHPDWADFEEV